MDLRNINGRLSSFAVSKLNKIKLIKIKANIFSDVMI